MALPTFEAKAKLLRDIMKRYARQNQEFDDAVKELLSRTKTETSTLERKLGNG